MTGASQAQPREESQRFRDLCRQTGRLFDEHGDGRDAKLFDDAPHSNSG